MSNFQPVVSPEIFALRPDFRALSIHANAVSNTTATPEASEALADACKSPCAETWAEAHREAWREAYRAFGAKPQRTPCSAEVLLKRALRDGQIPSANAVVDLYNAVSLRYAIPVGGENADAYVGTPHLTRATGSENFETMQSGVAVVEKPERGEVVWLDEHGVTCRRWNWRQGTRTRIETTTTNMWFVLEVLDPMPDEALSQAAAELIRGLNQISPGAQCEAHLLTRDQVTSVSIPVVP
jgi:DNA/RNA-binding domain of Phe-tRNA-synthetase-like protein